MKYVILIPIYNDRESLKVLINNINTEIQDLDSEISVVIINDASSQQIIDTYSNTENIQSLEIINMKENKGHARCIASGLKYIFEKKEFDYVIPMDGDGEDRPEEIKNFIQIAKQSGEKSIVGERVKRSESLFFKTCYQFHKFLTLSFTGQSIKFGNFTCLPKSTVKKMIDEKATWNSFSGSLKKTENTQYTDLENIKKEVVEAKRTFQKYKWPLIDVTRKSVEETAASIIKIHEIYSNNVK